MNPTTDVRVPRRRAWQTVFLLLGLIPASTSVLALVVGTERFVEASDVDVALDSTFRYFGGVYLGVALLVLWCVPKIEARSSALVFAGGAIFLGGLGRLASIADVGAPGTYTWFVLVIELGAVFLALELRRRVQRATT